MPVSRHRTQREISRQSFAESDSGGDTEREQTPRPHTARNFSKKRLSERFDPDGSFNLDDATNGTSKARPPLKSVNINDDVAEKRRRRKSAKVVLPLDPDDEPEAGPSNSANSHDATDGAAEGSRAANLAKQKSQLLNVPQVPVINVPIDVMTSNFDQWMKMATDNKINAANSWNFALIDYFHDMSLLRNNTDNSINFQRASCTLDGCVKIWTSRVDSVGTETGKLLSNLANGGHDPEDGEGSDDPDGADPSQSQRKRKAYRSESTLAKNPAQLRTKKLELEFSVDPLFRKTCADFDEGGAQGLLMNHLGLTVTPNGGLRVVFDASDSVAKGEEEEQPLEEPRDEVDLSFLREQFIPNLDSIEEQEISHSLEDFAFGKDSFSMDNTTFFRDGALALDDDDDDGNDGFGDAPDIDNAMDVDGVPNSAAPVEDFFVGDQAIPEDYGDFGAEYGPDGDTTSVGGSDGAPGEQKQGQFVAFDPRHPPNERDFVMAVGEDGEGMANYFDQNYFKKNWAGPEHWKLRKVVRRPDATDAAASRPKREKKEAFRIDFLAPPEEDVKTRKKKLFAPVVRGAGINLPGPAASKKGRGKRGKGKDKEEKRNNQTLPDDMHFSTKSLVTLFLKPRFSLKMRGHRLRLDGVPEGEVNEAFWAQAAANQAAGAGGEAGDDSAIPFDTQFFHDDDFDDGPGFDDVDDGVDGGLPVEADEQDLLAATQGQTRRVKPETVNYAKRAKRVDVRKLKENIWKGLEIVAPPVEDGEDAMDTDDQQPTDPTEARPFTSVITGLQKTYTKDKMDEISTSFCFICLLHLANERGLKLEVDGKVEDDDEDEDAAVGDSNKVGNLWDLKVYRDPNAAPAS
ncbi:barren [Dichomitus squalens LYAD-421 SS1]|uniref:barren n=1 Tax=Dichomitus squalens (strain LYAD-421) TaxID=732165 RepID=UPI0004411DCC|nr:barren [Dichomitus squalens LYAD-421 SS1]EJF64153.1 barren [Dichomitus squalens LYAD-421 SS1]